MLELSVRVSLQEVSGSLGKSNLSRNKWEKSDLSKETYIYDDDTKGGWGILEICHVFADSIIFEQLIYCSFLKTVGNFAITQDPRGHVQVMQGYKTKSCSVFKSVESHGSLS